MRGRCLYTLIGLLLAALPAFAAAPLSFEEVDTDGDGLVSADEAANVAGLDFDAADADHVGLVSTVVVRVKCGTLNATNALSGYMTAKSGRTLTFSMYANDVPSGANARAIMDKALVLVAEEN